MAKQQGKQSKPNEVSQATPMGTESIASASSATGDAPLMPKAERTAPPKPEAMAKVTKGLSLGITEDTVTMKRREFDILIKSLTRGYVQNYEGISLTVQIQKMFELSTFADARRLHSIILKGK